jgi:hypothetical protein
VIHELREDVASEDSRRIPTLLGVPALLEGLEVKLDNSLRVELSVVGGRR